MIDFAKLEFDDLTSKRLFDFCVENRLGMAEADDRSSLTPKDFKFHVTVMYSRVTNPAFEEIQQSYGPHVLVPEAFELFGPNRNILALTLRDDPVLTEIFDHYGEKFGHVSEFTSYRPHVSIRGSSADVKDRIASLPLPDFELRVDRLIQKRKIKAT
ncbi:hypothetical protein [Rhizobium sp. BK176]|uniref:hypothetical protein n=1 Tax=Rhizobium sp. BK176 TaxID=2587071 RepID=UPI00216AA709|nr:hypothetical protein [Rhizobium sp. BK176]MCS4090177.1 hypothetical protein [Rhizobium sp. BK176]